jgi:APA family basic amino acid/polyamine antiporter
MAFDPHPSAESGLVRALGVRQMAAAIFNYTVASGIFALPALAYGRLGAAAPLGYLATVLVMALVVLCIAAAGSRVAITGGPYAYVEVALGSYVGLLAGALLWATDLAATAAVANLFAGSVVALFGGAGAAVAVPTLIVAVFLGLSWLNVRGVRTGARLIELATVAKLLPLLAFVAVGAFFVHPAHFRMDRPVSVGDVSRTVGVLVFAFAGIEAALTPSGEIRTPSRTVPRAALLALGGAALLYLLIQGVAQGVLGPQLAEDRVTPLATAAGAFAGVTGRTVILAGAAVSMFGYLTGAILAAPRTMFAFGRDGFLPRALAAVHPRFHTPHVAIITYGVLATALALSGTFEALAILANSTVLLLYFLCAIAALVLQRRDQRADAEPFRLPAGALLPVLAGLAVAWIFVRTVSPREILAVVIVVAVVTVAWGIRARRASP